MFSVKKYKIFFSGLIMVLFFLILGQAVLAAPGAALTNTLDGLDKTATGGGVKPTVEKNLPTIIGGVVGGILALVGVIFFLLILYAGFNWMMAQGDEAKITKAKDTIFSAALGLIVILGASAVTTLTARLFSEALGLR